MNSFRRSLLGLGLGLGLAGLALINTAAFAQEVRGSKADAKAMADAALVHIAKAGFDTAIKDFTHDRDRWVNKDIYVAAFNFEGLCLAHGANEKLVGKQVLELKDPSGRSIIRDFIGHAQKAPESWTDIEWAHPVTKKPEPKHMNVRRVPGKDAVIVVGYYR